MIYHGSLAPLLPLTKSGDNCLIWRIWGAVLLLWLGGVLTPFRVTFNRLASVQRSICSTPRPLFNITRGWGSHISILSMLSILKALPRPTRAPPTV